METGLQRFTKIVSNMRPRVVFGAKMDDVTLEDELSV